MMLYLDKRLLDTVGEYLFGDKSQQFFQEMPGIVVANKKLHCQRLFLLGKGEEAAQLAGDLTCKKTIGP